MTALKDVLCPPSTQDDLTEWLMSEEGGFIYAKRLEDGTYAGVLQLAFTYAICTGLTRCNIERRYCFERPITNCLWAFKHLKSFNDEPTGWISSRPKPLAEDLLPISTAPRDGAYIRAYKFNQFDSIQWCRTAAYQDGWVEVDSCRDGEPLDPTHWKPE